MRPSPTRTTRVLYELEAVRGRRLRLRLLLLAVERDGPRGDREGEAGPQRVGLPPAAPHRVRGRVFAGLRALRPAEQPRDRLRLRRLAAAVLGQAARLPDLGFGPLSIQK